MIALIEYIWNTTGFIYTIIIVTFLINKTFLAANIS